MIKLLIDNTVLYYTNSCSVSTFVGPTHLRRNKLSLEMLDIVKKKLVKFFKTHHTGHAVKEKVPLKNNEIGRDQARETMLAR